MRIGLSAWLFGFVIAVPSGCAQERVYSELKDQRYWFRTVIVSPGAFTLPQIEQACRDFLRSAARGRAVAVFSMFTDVEDAAMAHVVDRDSYRQWKVYYDSVSPRQIQAAEVVAIDGDTVLRIRHADGTVLRRILSGKDPLRLEINGSSFEILVLIPRVGTRFDDCEPGASLSPLLYVRTTAPINSGVCERATMRLAELVKSRKVFVSFKNDHWFISFGLFPVIYPFAANEPPPSEEAYYNSPAMTCSVLRKWQLVVDR